MAKNLALLLPLAVLLGLVGCRGTVSIEGLLPDDDDDAGDDDAGDDDAGDDDAGDDDAGDDDAGDDDAGDDDAGDDDGGDDDTGPPDICQPNWTLACGSSDQWNNSGDGSTDQITRYACSADSVWTGPEYTYALDVPAGSDVTITLRAQQGDLDLLVLASRFGACDPEGCVDSSTNPPPNSEEVVLTTDGDATYFVVVEGWDGATSDYTIEVACAGGGDDDDAGDDDAGDDDAGDDDAGDDDAGDDDAGDDDAGDDDAGDDDAGDDDTAASCIDFVVRANGSDEASLYAWGGAGFDPESTVNPPGGGQVWAAVAGDFDGDGGLDYITERQNNQGDLVAQVFLQDCATGDFAEINLSGAGFTFGNALDDVHGVGDVDGDGDLDVIGWNYNDGEGRVWLNGGDGESWTAVANAFELQEWDPNDDGTHESVAVPLVDINRDGDVDLVECFNNLGPPTSCVVHEGQGDGTFIDGATFSVDRLVNGFALGDFNGDGAVDMVGGLDDDGDAGQTWIWLGSAGGALPSGQGTPSFDVNTPDAGNDSNAPGYGWPFAADLDGDGSDEIVVTVMDPFATESQVMYWVDDVAGTPVVTSMGSVDNAWGNGGALIQMVVGVPVHP